MAGELKVIYNNNLIHTSTADDTFTLNCNGKLMASDVTIQATDVDSLTVTYGGNTIATGSGTTTKILSCDGKVMSSNVGVAVTMASGNLPRKGDIINIDMNGDGTDEQYLVLKSVGGSVFELLPRENFGSSVFGTTQTYENSTVDTYLNSTYYNTFSATAKAAIVDKTIRQESWYYANGGIPAQGSPAYIGTYLSGSIYWLSLGNASFGNAITRHVYLPSIQDVLDYLGTTPEMTSENTTLTLENTQAMFNLTAFVMARIRDADASRSDFVGQFYPFFGYITMNSLSSNMGARGQFQIDLDKIAWSKV